jgi:tetratricopeptide (TPR) repeat protein
MSSSSQREMMALFRARAEAVTEWAALMRWHSQADLETKEAATCKLKAINEQLEDMHERADKLFELWTRTHRTKVTRESMLAHHARVGQMMRDATRAQFVVVLATTCDAVAGVLVERKSLSVLERVDDIDKLPFVRFCASAFLLCRAISSPLVRNGVVFVAEDLRGNAFSVHVAHVAFADQAIGDRLVRTGLIFAIKNPWFTLRGESWDPAVRCVPLENFVALHDTSSELLRDTPWFEAPCATALEWKLRGNVLFASQQFDGAVAAYSRGIELDGGAVDLLANRSMAQIQLGEWRAALDDVDAVLAIEPRHAKSLARRVVVLGKLRRYSDALAALTSAGAIENADEQRRRLDTLEQQSRGEYDFADIFRKSWLGGNAARAPIASYVHSALHYAPTTVAGRAIGTFARTALPRCTLVIVDEVLARCGGQTPNVTLLDELFRTAQTDSFVRAQVDELLGALKIDADLNGDSCWYARVRELCLSYFDVFLGGPNDLMSAQRDGAVPPRALGFHVARINHSCVPNCVISGWGDFFVVQTSRDIAAGEELFVAHVVVDQPLAVRTKALAVRQFVCHCARCAHEAADRVCQQLAQQLANFQREAGEISAARVRTFSNLLASNNGARQSLLASLLPLAFPKSLVDQVRQHLTASGRVDANLHDFTLLNELNALRSIDCPVDRSKFVEIAFMMRTREGVEAGKRWLSIGVPPGFVSAVMDVHTEMENEIYKQSQFLFH